MPFLSKGFNNQGDDKRKELVLSLQKVSNGGELPIVFDTSPCAKTVIKYIDSQKENKLKIYDSIEFIADYILNKLNIKKTDERITLHSTCSSIKMELNDKLIKIAESCAESVYIPEEIKCCGFAGDRGFSYPELNESALKSLRESIELEDCTLGFSSSKTCEIGLSLHSGIEYNSIAYLVDECSSPKSSNTN